jgi:hypothetical protein
LGALFYWRLAGFHHHVRSEFLSNRFELLMFFNQTMWENVEFFIWIPS